MNLHAFVEEKVRSALVVLTDRGTLPQGLDLGRVVVEASRDPTHGDLSTNAAMVLSKAAGKSPIDIAQALAHAMATDPVFVAVSVAGKGFVNMTLQREILNTVLIAALDPDYGTVTMRDEAPINIEYVSANPTGPLHVGHGRGAVFGDALANLLEKAGHPVVREYYINDAGAQIEKLARSAHLRYREVLGEDIGAFPEGLYPGDYVVPVAEGLAHHYGENLLTMPEEEWMPLVKEAAISTMMMLITEDLGQIDIQHDVFTSEREVIGEDGENVALTIKALRAKGLVYQGVLPPPKGKAVSDWTPQEQTLFRSTQFGDDVDRALVKADGTFTYFAPDIAYHADKWKRGSNHLINVLGADHDGYVKRMRAAVSAISDGAAHLDVKVCQLVNLFDNGVPVRMSKRGGTFVTLREVVDQVGADAVRFMMLYRKNDAPLDFDMAKVIDKSKDNPVFYVQYAHARCCSVIRRTQETWPDSDFSSEALERANLHHLSMPSAVAALHKIAAYPRLIEAAAQAHEPHRIAFYLYELAAALHVFWTDTPIINFNSEDASRAHIALIAAIRNTLASGLAILGVSAPETL